MDLPLEHLLALLKQEPGAGLGQIVLLFMIWLNGKGLKREVKSMREDLKKLEITHEVRLGSLEKRVDFIEGKDK